jgi:hypothetical protein
MTRRCCRLARVFRQVVIVLGLLLCAACGASRPGPQVTSPFSERDATLFDDGVDLLEDPDALAGQWRTAWEDELSERVERGDSIVEGTVTRLNAQADPDQRTSYRIELRVERVHRGHPGKKELTLISREGALGYPSLASNPDRVLGRAFIAFIKYVEGPRKEPVPRFHLTPPSVALRRGIESPQAK